MQQTNQEYRSSYNAKEFITKVTTRLQEYETQYEQSLQRKHKSPVSANTNDLDEPILNNNTSFDESSDESSDESDWANKYDVNSDDENQVSAMTRSRLTEKAIEDANDEDERNKNLQMKNAVKAAFNYNYFPIKASKTENRTQSNGTTYISFVTKTTFVLEKDTGLVFEISKADPELETETMAYEEGKSFKDLEFTSSWADVDEADASLFDINLPNISVNIGLDMAGNDEDKYLPEYFDFFARFELIDYYSTEESDYTRERKENSEGFRLPNFTRANIELMEQNWVQYARDKTIVRRLEDAYENLSSMRATVDMYPDERKGLGIVLDLWEEEEYDTLDEDKILEKLKTLDPDLQDTSYSNFLDPDPIRKSFSGKNIRTYINEGEKGKYKKQSKEKELNKSNIKVKLKKTGDGGYKVVNAPPKKPKPATINPPVPRVTIKYTFEKFKLKYAKFNSSSDYYYRFDTDIQMKDYMNVMLADPDPDGFAKLEPELQTLYVTAAMMRSRFKEYLFVNSKINGYDYYNVPDFIEAFILKEATEAFKQLKSNPSLTGRDKDVLINTIGCYGGWLYAKSKLDFNTELKNFVLKNAEDIISKFEEKIYKEKRKNGHQKNPTLPALKPIEVLKLTHGAQYVSWWNKEIKPSSNPKKHYERYKSIILEKCLVSIDRFKTSYEKITKRNENASISGVMIQDLDLILELFLCVPCILKRAYKTNVSSSTIVLNIDKLINTIIYHCFSVQRVDIQRQVLHLLLISIYIQNIVKEPSCEGLDSFGKENTSKIPTVRYKRRDTNLKAEIEEKLLTGTNIKLPTGTNIKVNLVEFGRALSRSSENQQEFLLDDDIEKYKDKASKNANDYYYYQLLLLRKKMLETTFHNQYEIIPNTTYFRVKQPPKGRSTQHTQLHSDYFNVVFNDNTKKITDLTVAQDCRTIWVPLTDISISSSYLKIAKHCLPLDSNLGYFDPDEFTGIPIPKYVDENTEDLAYKIGDYVAFGLNVPHEGTPHKSKDKIRVSFDFRIQPRKQLNNPDAAAERLLNDFRIILEYLQTKYRRYNIENTDDIKKQKQWAFARDIEFLDDFRQQLKDLILQTKISTDLIPKFKSLFYTYKMNTELLVQYTEEEKLAYNKLSTADFKKKYIGITKKQISELNEILTVVSRWYPKKEGTSFFKMFWKILPRSDTYAWTFKSDAANKRDANERWEGIKKDFEKEPSGNDLYVILRDLEKCILTEKMLKKGKNGGKRRMVLAPFISFQYPYEEVSFLNADLEKEVIDYYFFQSRSATHEPPDRGLDFYKYARLTVSGAYNTAKYGQSLRNLDTNWFIAYKQLCHIWFNVNTKLFKVLKNLKDNFLVYFNLLRKYFDYPLIDANTLNAYDESSEDEKPTEIEGAVDLDAPVSDADDTVRNPPKGKEDNVSKKKTPKEVSI